MSGPGLRIFAAIIAGLVMAACGRGTGPGTAWGDGSFGSNGERIYFTATSDRDSEIDYTGGPDIGGMMMGGQVSCASCHGADAGGGLHNMGMDVMNAPPIRWDALGEHATEPHEDSTEGDHAAEEQGGYDFDTFRLAVTEGVHPDGEALSDDMPRWEISEADLRDLVDYLQSLTTT